MTDAEKIRALKDEHAGELTPEARLFMELAETRTMIVELGKRMTLAAGMLTELCHEGLCPLGAVMASCPHGSICNRITVAEWRRWLEGKE